MTTSAFVVAALVASGASPSETSFEKMKTLVGTWSAPLSTPGKEVRVSFRLVSNDSTLVETSTSPSGRETMTVFHVDGGRVLATHYCAQGNQPRLALTKRGDKPASWAFDYVDATNLSSPQASHLHHLDLVQTDDGHFVLTETYRENGKDQADTYRFARVGTAPPGAAAKTN